MRAAAIPLTLLLTALALLPAAPGAAPGDADARLPLCDAPVHVPGQGLSCPAPGGGWVVPLANGGAVFTHGPDPLPAAVLPTLTMEAEVSAAPSAPPACVTDTTQPHVQVLFTHSADFPSRYDVVKPFVLAGVAQTNGILLRDALQHGVDMRFKVRCDADGAIHLPQVRLLTPSASDSFGSIVNDLNALGWSNPAAKYWIVHDGFVACGCGGQGSGWGDDRAGPDNWNNKGGLHAISYVGNYGRTQLLYSLSQVMLHEAGHTMGAVQNSAPHTTNAFHCTDGADVMCYNDGGSRGREYTFLACPRAPEFEAAWTWAWDCNNDDYFHPEPAPGSYLATHWNVGSPDNRYLTWQRVA